MSNIALKGDVIQNLGEYLPNPYIESIEVEESSSSSINVNIFYSFIFLINDEYNAEDISKNLQDINIMFAFARSESPLKKQEIVNAIVDAPDGQGGTLREALAFFIDDVNFESIFDKLSDGDYIDDLYDEEGRRIFKITSQHSRTLPTASFANDNFYCYGFSSTQTLANLEANPKNIIYLNTGNIAYEKLFSPGLNILREEEVIYVGSQGEKYGQVPILGLNRNFYKTENVTREDIISKVNALVKRFEGRTIGPLSDSVNSIKTVLSKEADTENLLVQLDKVRRSFPNKTNNNRVGNLYAAFAVLLRNINSAFRPVDIVKKEKYLTGKVLDLRENPVAAYEAPTQFSLDQYIPEGMFFLHRERLSEDETSDLAINRGMFFIRYEEMLKRESDIGQLIDIDKFYETVTGLELETLKRILFSYFRPSYIKVQKSDPNEETLGGFMYSITQQSIASRRDSRETSYIYSNRNPQSQAASIDQSSEFYSERFREYNFGFDNPSERMLCYSFVDADSFSAVYETNQENFGMIFDYKIDVSIRDDTNEFVTYLVEKFFEVDTLLQDYKDLANEICSYNNIDNKFNDFFVKSIRDRYTDGVYPWEVAPSIYSVMVYILTEQFPNFEDVIRYSKNVSATINPENGNLDSLTNFANAMTSLKQNQIAILAFGSAGRYRGTTREYQLEKTFNVLSFNYSDIVGEAAAEFESLFRNKMNYYFGADIRVDGFREPRRTDTNDTVSSQEKTKAQFMVLLLEAIEIAVLQIGFLYAGGNIRLDSGQERSLGILIQSYINNLQIFFRDLRNDTLKTKGFVMFEFGKLSEKTIEQETIHGLSVDFFLDLINLYEEATPGGEAPNYSDVSDLLNEIANLIYNYYNSPIIPRFDGKPNLQYDITVADFITIPVQNDIRDMIVLNLDPELPVPFDSYTGPDITEIAGYEDISF